MGAGMGRGTENDNFYRLSCSLHLEALSYSRATSQVAPVTLTPPGFLLSPGVSNTQARAGAQSTT